MGETIEPGNKRTLASFVDPDARFGHTSARDGFAGYKVHVAQDTTSEVVTSVETLPGNAHEGKATERLLDQEAERNVHHKGVVADAFYDNQQTFTELTKREMTAYIPAKYPKKRASAFTYDVHGDELICPLGKRSIGKVVRDDGAIYRFSAKDCGGCSVEGCKQPTKRQAEVHLSEVEKVRRRVPEEEMAWAMEERKKVERRFGQAKRHHGMNRTRYRGRWRMAIQALMTFFVINAKRMVKLLAARARGAIAVPG